MMFRRLSRSGIAFLPFLIVLGGCGSREASQPSTASSSTGAVTTTPPIAGVRTFVIVPGESTASYHANEEFFAGAFRRLGMQPGKIEAVGSTQAVQGHFQLDPARPTAGLGDHTFTVRMDMLTSDQSRRDDYLREVRDDGPSFYSYPLATFKATAVESGSSANSGAGELNIRLTGDLTIREITRRKVFDVKARLSGDTLTGTGTTRFLLSDFGIGPISFYDTLTVADAIGIEVQFTARVQPK
ncbi:MAG: YceI family protein [Acidobacteria bacterium]|nr:YceI family protein [Acidobacteriota bacterium]